jgi:chorismate lyase/3-hydroxybenzoate synthase
MPVQLDYVAPEEMRDFLQDGGRHVLGEIHFGTELRDMRAVAHPHVVIPMRQLGASPLVEVWTCRAPVSYYRSGNITFARNDEVLFGCLSYSAEDSRDIESAARNAYAGLLAVIEEQGCPNLLRMWNYFPEITRASGDLDCYKRFCRGRFEALAEHYGEFDRMLPSASAVGDTGGGLSVYFISTRVAGVHCENPRQISAYCYPPQYGPRSPSFARATLKHWGTDVCLYISGTASIVGHESRHPGDPLAQVTETLHNLRALIESAGQKEHAGLYGLANLVSLKVYVRNPEELGIIRQGLDAAIDPQVPRLYLQADICRTELLLEIEGIARATS